MDTTQNSLGTKSVEAKPQYAPVSQTKTTLDGKSGTVYNVLLKATCGFQVSDPAHIQEAQYFVADGENANDILNAAAKNHDDGVKAALAQNISNAKTQAALDAKNNLAQLTTAADEAATALQSAKDTVTNSLSATENDALTVLLPVLIDEDKRSILMQYVDTLGINTSLQSQLAAATQLAADTAADLPAEPTFVDAV